MELFRKENESDEELIYRICSVKESIGSWQDVADILNELLGYEYTESKYRKQYQSFCSMIKANKDKFVSSDTISQNIQEQKNALEIERIKTRDQRTELNRSYREIARGQENLRILAESIPKKQMYDLSDRDNISYNDTDMFVSISDVHYGETTSNYFGENSSSVVERRFKNYLNNIIKIQNVHCSQNCYVGLMGDLISGNIHNTIRISNRENAIQQIIGCSELISEFIFELSKHFKYVKVNSVSGNHTRLQKKDDSLRDERLDDLIIWYLKAKLQNIVNVKFMDDNIDSTISTMNIRGKEYFMVHGDYDYFTESGVSKLVMMCGFKPAGIFYGHKHVCSYDEVAGVSMIRSGSFSDTSGDFCVTKRISGVASQMVCILDINGVSACYPVKL